MQPSPYSSNLKPMNDDELTVTLKKSPNTMPLWRISEIAVRNDFYVNNIQPFIASTWSLTDAFDHEPRPIYVDDCCHVNELGNQILFEAILKKIGSRRL
jgi:hypothetical protein